MTVAKKIISTLLVAAVAVGIGLVLALLLPQGEYPPPEPTHTEMADTTIHTGRLPGYENAPQNTTPEYFWYLFNGSLAMGKDGSRAAASAAGSWGRPSLSCAAAPRDLR